MPLYYTASQRPVPADWTTCTSKLVLGGTWGRTELRSQQPLPSPSPPLHRQLLQQAQPSWLHVPAVLIPVPWEGSHGASLREAVREGGGGAWLGAQEFLLSQLKLPDGYPGDNRTEIIYIGNRGDYLNSKTGGDLQR